MNVPAPAGASKPNYTTDRDLARALSDIASDIVAVYLCLGLELYRHWAVFVRNMHFLMFG